MGATLAKQSHGGFRCTLGTTGATYRNNVDKGGGYLCQTNSWGLRKQIRNNVELSTFPKTRFLKIQKGRTLDQKLSINQIWCQQTFLNLFLNYLLIAIFHFSNKMGFRMSIHFQKVGFFFQNVKGFVRFFFIFPKNTIVNKSL